MCSFNVVIDTDFWVLISRVMMEWNRIGSKSTADSLLLLCFISVEFTAVKLNTFTYLFKSSMTLMLSMRTPVLTRVVLILGMEMKDLGPTKFTTTISQQNHF